MRYLDKQPNKENAFCTPFSTEHTNSNYNHLMKHENKDLYYIIFSLPICSTHLFLAGAFIYWEIMYFCSVGEI